MANRVTSGAKRPAFSFVLSPDSFLLSQEVKRLTDTFLTEKGKWKKDVYWGDEAPPASFWDAFMSLQFFSSQRCVIVHNAQAWKKTVWEKLDAQLLRVSSICWPIFLLEVDFPKNTPSVPIHISKSKSYALAKKNGWIVTVPPITERMLSAYLAARAKEYPHIPPAVLHNLVLTVPLEAGCIENELRKLDVFYETKPASSSLDLPSDRFEELNVFAIIDLVLQGRIHEVIKAISRQQDVEKAFFMLLLMLVREFRMLWQLKAGMNPKIPDFVLSKKTALTRRLHYADLAKATGLVLDAEFKAKLSLSPTPQILDEMLIGLATIFRQN